MVTPADRQEMSRWSINRLFDGTYSVGTMSVVHPGSDSSATDSSGKAKASATQREVADQIPYQGSELHHRGEKSANGRMKLAVIGQETKAGREIDS